MLQLNDCEMEISFWVKEGSWALATPQKPLGWDCGYKHSLLKGSNDVLYFKKYAVELCSLAMVPNCFCHKQNTTCIVNYFDPTYWTKL